MPRHPIRPRRPRPAEAPTTMSGTPQRRLRSQATRAAGLGACALAYTTAGDGKLCPSVDATIFVVVLVVIIFAADMLFRWWRENEWRRRWKRGPQDDEAGGD